MAKKKNFYAVRKGLEPGIYKSWDECKKQVIGVKGGVEYKGFVREEDALAYLNGAENEAIIKKEKESKEEKKKRKIAQVERELELTKELSSTQNNIVVYIDGSYSSAIKNCPYTYGVAVIQNNEVIFEDKGFGEDEEAKKLNNVSGELLGAMKAVLHVVNNHREIKTIHIFHDYQGVSSWVTKEWKAKNNMVKKYVEFIKSLESKYNVSIQFVKVAGHQGNPFNELVDRLAKEALDIFK